MSSRPTSQTSASSSSIKKVSGDQKVVVLTKDDREWLCEEIRGLKEENERLRAMVRGLKVTIPTIPTSPSPTPSAQAFLANSPRSSSPSTSSPPPSTSRPLSATSAPGSSDTSANTSPSNPDSATAAIPAAVKKSDYRISNMLAEHFPKAMHIPAGKVPHVVPFEQGKQKAEGVMPTI